MEIKIIARTEQKGSLNISDRIIRIETIRADKKMISDFSRIVEFLEGLGYTVDG